MNQEIKLVQKENEGLARTVNLALYFEKCAECSAPARSEDVIYDLNGNDIFQFCVNPRCINFDGSNLRQKRNQLENYFRKSAVWRRHLKTLWRPNFAERKAKRMAALRG